MNIVSIPPFRRIVAVLSGVLAMSALACTENGKGTTLGDTDSDIAGDRDGSDTDGVPPFQYAACADPTQRPQFPTPRWLVDDPTTATGKRMVVPGGDAAAQLLWDTRPDWARDMEGLDGFAHAAQWIIALGTANGGEAVATGVDPSRIAGLWPDGTGGFAAKDWRFDAKLIDNGKALFIQALRFMEGAPPILVLREGAVSGAHPLPACEGATAHVGYIDAANAARAVFPDVVWAIPHIATAETRVLPALAAHLKANPALAVKTVAAAPVADLDFDKTAKPDANTLEALADAAYTGRFTLPWYADAEGHWRADPTTLKPDVRGTTEPGFVLLLPKVGTGPFPVVLFQHGGGRRPEDAALVAKPYADAGFAVLGIDLPYHNRRKPASGPQGDLSMADFKKIRKTRDNFRQAAADHLAVLTGLAALNAALEPLTGKPQTLNTARPRFMGHSMGSISGTLTTGAAAGVIDLAGAALLGGGVSFTQLVREGLFTLFLTDVVDEAVPDLHREILLAQAQCILDGGDPLNAALHTLGAGLGNADVLIFEAVADPVANNTATDWQGLAFGAFLAPPSHHPVAGMTSKTGGFSGADFAGGTGTRALRQIDYGPSVGSAAIHMAVFTDIRVHQATAACFGTNPCNFDMPE